MNSQHAVDLGQQAIQVCLLVGGPVLLIGLVIGLVIGTLQSMTGIHDQTVSFVPKVLLTIVAIALALPWLSQQLVDYTRETLQQPVTHRTSESNFAE